MPTWKDLLSEVTEAGGGHDVVRRRYLRKLANKTKRNVIVYYSGWLQKENLPSLQPLLRVSDNDKNGFMAAIHNMDRDAGLDLILHTPGGDVAATESLVDYLRSMFDTNIRAIVPQIAMSAGTMIACASKQIIMGKHSSLGPIDPQIGGLPAHGILEEWNRAHMEAKKDQLRIPFWQPIIAKYPPTLIGECEKAIAWSEEMVRAWLESGMFAGDTGAAQKAERVVSELGDHALTKSHARHISIAKAREIGLNVAALEEDDQLQDIVLSIHHACIQTLTATPAVKIIENQRGVAFISSAQIVGK